VDTFLTALYVMVDNLCHTLTQKQRHPGPSASLSPTEVVTLAIFARWGRFGSERDFYRYADAYLRDAFPTLPDSSQFNRCVRLQLELIEDVALQSPFPLWRPSRDVAERVLPLLQTLLQSSQLNYRCFEYREQYKGRPNIL